MNTFTSHPQEPPLKRKWEEEEKKRTSSSSSSSSSHAPMSLHQTPPILTGDLTTLSPPPPRRPLELPAIDMAVVRSVVPPVTVALEGRAICHRIRLQEHAGYGSLAAALRRMFVDGEGTSGDQQGLNLGNAVPGHVVAYEDMEDDLLLAGDLSWKDFVRVVKRIRIVPTKPNRRRNGNPPAVAP